MWKWYGRKRPWPLSGIVKVFTSRSEETTKPVSGSRPDPRTYRIRNSNANHYTTTFDVNVSQVTDLQDIFTWHFSIVVTFHDSSWPLCCSSLHHCLRSQSVFTSKYLSKISFTSTDIMYNAEPIHLAGFHWLLSAYRTIDHTRTFTDCKAMCCLATVWCVMWSLRGAITIYDTIETTRTRDLTYFSL
jgi:hypothetical protein